MADAKSRACTRPNQPEKPISENSGNDFFNGISSAIASGFLPIDHRLWTFEKLVEIAGCSESVARKDLREAKVKYRDFFAHRWYEVAHLAERFPLVDPAVTPPRRGGARRRKGSQDEEAESPQS